MAFILERYNSSDDIWEEVIKLATEEQIDDVIELSYKHHAKLKADNNNILYQTFFTDSGQFVASLRARWIQ